jgi:multidrug resistance efflux pump
MPALAAGEDALINNQRQKALQDARILQAEAGIRTAQADIEAAHAGVEAANSALANARSALEGTKADVARTELEQHRQEALIATEIGDSSKTGTSDGGRTALPCPTNQP